MQPQQHSCSQMSFESLRSKIWFMLQSEWRQRNGEDVLLVQVQRPHQTTACCKDKNNSVIQTVFFQTHKTSKGKDMTKSDHSWLCEWWLQELKSKQQNQPAVRVCVCVCFWHHFWCVPSPTHLLFNKKKPHICSFADTCAQAHTCKHTLSRQLLDSFIR